LLASVHKAIDQMKANAEKEARLTLSAAEVQAEKILQGAQQRLADLQSEIAGLKQHRLQLESRLRSIVQSYQQLLATEPAEAAPEQPEPIV
jgi:cell division initiation protein